MLEKIKNINLFSSNSFTIIGIILGDTINYNVLVVKKNGEELNLDKSFTTNDFDFLNKNIDKKSSVIINFSGKGIVNKKVASKGNFLKEVLFNAPIENFYTYTLYQKQYNFVSVCRKDVINEQLSLFEKVDLKPVDYSIGPFVSFLSKKIMNAEILTLENHQFEFQDEEMVAFKSIETSSIEYDLGKEKLKSRDVSLLSSLLNFLYPSAEIEYEKQLVSQNIKEQKLKKIFDFFAVGSVVFFLIALLSSYLLLDYYNSKYIKHEEQLYQLNDTYSQLKKLEEELGNKQFIIENLGITNKNFLSYYIHEIGNSTPSQILLSNLKINPIEKKIKKNENISFDSNIILVEGTSSSNMYVNNWVKKLNKYSWIDKIEILNLTTSSNAKESFLIRININ